MLLFATLETGRELKAKYVPKLFFGIATGRRAGQLLANFFPVTAPLPFSFFIVANAVEEIYLYLDYLQSQRILAKASLLLVILFQSCCDTLPSQRTEYKVC